MGHSGPPIIRSRWALLRPALRLWGAQQAVQLRQRGPAPCRCREITLSSGHRSKPEFPEQVTTLSAPCQKGTYRPHSGEPSELQHSFQCKATTRQRRQRTRIRQRAPPPADRRPLRHHSAAAGKWPGAEDVPLSRSHSGRAFFQHGGSTSVPGSARDQPAFSYGNGACPLPLISVMFVHRFWAHHRSANSAQWDAAQPVHFRNRSARDAGGYSQ